MLLPNKIVEAPTTKFIVSHHFNIEELLPLVIINPYILINQYSVYWSISYVNPLAPNTISIHKIK